MHVCFVFCVCVHVDVMCVCLAVLQAFPHQSTKHVRMSECVTKVDVRWVEWCVRPSYSTIFLLYNLNPLLMFFARDTIDQDEYTPKNFYHAFLHKPISVHVCLETVREVRACETSEGRTVMLTRTPRGRQELARPLQEVYIRDETHVDTIRGSNWSEWSYLFSFFCSTRLMENTWNCFICDICRFNLC